MSSPQLTDEQQAAAIIAKSMAAGRAAADATYQTTNDPRLASQAASRAISHAISHSAAGKAVIDAFLLLVNPILTAFFSTLGQVRHGVTETMGETTAEVLNEFLGTSFDASVLETGGAPDQTLAKCNKIGTAVLDRLEQEFTGGGTVSEESGAAGARTFAGYGVNFAIQNAIISLIGACIPEVHLDDIRELGVEVAQNLGLGRLMNRALRPLVENTITKPYNRQLQRKYRMDVLPVAELATAQLADTMPGNRAQELLEGHGLSDDQITELLRQKTPRLKDSEFEMLQAMGEGLPDQDLLHDAAIGTPKEVIDLRLKVLKHKRLERVRDRVLHEMLSQINEHFVPPSAFHELLDRMQVPADEQEAWMAAAGLAYERVAKRMSHNEVLFLYEASQITDNEVEAWLREERYSETDVQNLLTFFRLKAAEAANKGSGGAAARVAHLHKEHVAYVTDEITGLFGRAPTKAELDYWVNLLDLAERTKHDFVTELKGLDPAGSAIPPA